jgi:hypothetical protein
MWPRTVYVAPSGVHGTVVVFVFFTWKVTGCDVTFTALPTAAEGRHRTTAAARAAQPTTTRIFPVQAEAAR